MGSIILIRLLNDITNSYCGSFSDSSKPVSACPALGVVFFVHGESLVGCPKDIHPARSGLATLWELTFYPPICPPVHALPRPMAFDCGCAGCGRVALDAASWQAAALVRAPAFVACL
jgi:hypothetical protein